MIRILAILICAHAAIADRPVADIAALIDAAQPGAVVRPEPGVYTGNLRITRTVTLDAPGVIIDARGEGTVVEITADNVVIRNVTVRNSGASVHSEPAGIRALAPCVVIERCRIENALFGIDLKGAADAVIRDNVVVGKDLDPGRRGDGIRLWWSHNSTIEDNHVERARDMVFWYSENLVIRRNHVADSRYGLHFMYSHDTTLSGNTLIGNSVGVYLMYSNGIRLVGNTMTNNRGASGYGVGLKDCDDITLDANALLANRVGVYLDNSPSSVDSTGLIEGNLIAFNEIGLVATPNTHDNVVTRNAFVENEEQAAVHGRGDLANNTFSRDGVGNYWSDYAGFDLDADGRGDLPHEPRSLFSSMLAREPNLRLFVHSPAQQAVEFTARALPEFQPAPILSDQSPLTRAPSFELRAETRTSPWPMAMLGVVVISAAAALFLTSLRSDRLPAPRSITP